MLTTNLVFGFTGCGKLETVKGTGFSLYMASAILTWGLAPEGMET
jgi:hypothetical protein